METDYSKDTLSMEDKMVAGAFGRARNYGYKCPFKDTESIIWNSPGVYIREQIWQTLETDAGGAYLTCQFKNVTSVGNAHSLLNQITRTPSFGDPPEASGKFHKSPEFFRKF